MNKSSHWFVSDVPVALYSRKGGNLVSFLSMRLMIDCYKILHILTDFVFFG